MPDRIVRDELLESDRWLNVPRNTHRLAFVCLLLQADALGNMEGSDGRLWRLWRDTLKLDARTAIAEILEALLSQDLIRLYEVDGKRLIHIPRYRQRLRYLGSVSPPSPWTTEDQKQRLEKRSPGASQVVTGRAPAEVKRREVEVKRSEEKNFLTPGLGVDVDLQRARETRTPNPDGDKSPKAKSNPPPRPARGVADQKGVEALARYFGVWPLTGEPGRDWGMASDYVNRLRAEHFRQEREARLT